MKTSGSAISPHTAMAIIILNHLGGQCEASVLPLLLGISSMEFSKCVQEMDGIHILKGSSTSHISIDTVEQQPPEVLECALLSSTFYKKRTVALALFHYYQKNFKIFLEQAITALQVLADQSNVLLIRRAYDTLAHSIFKIKIPLQDRSFCLFFINKCMNIQRIILQYPSNSRYQTLLFQKIKGIAFFVGDKRSIGYINICKGAMSQNVRSLTQSKFFRKNLKQGKETVFSLGDKDIILMSSQFIILYYLLEAKFIEGLNFSYSILFSGDNNQDKNENHALYNYASICAVSLGNYELASAILNSGIKIINNSKNASQINKMKGILSYIFILQGKDKDALLLTKELLGEHIGPIRTYADLWASRVLALYYYKQGEIQESYRVFEQVLQKNNHENISHSNYLLAPFVLELLGAYHIVGYNSPRELSIYDELKYSMASPSRLIRAVAFCVAGQIRAHEYGWDDPQVSTYLNKSLRLHRTFPAPPDMAKTLISLARMHQALGEKDEARDAGLEAWMICRQYGHPSWPRDLDALLPLQEIEIPDNKLSFDLNIQLLHNIRSQSSFNIVDDFSNNVLGSLLATLEMTSGCILHGKEGPPQKILSVNMDFTSDQSSPKEPWRKVVEKTFNEKQSIVKKQINTDLQKNNNTNKTELSISIFVDALDYGVYVIYLTGKVFSHVADSITDDSLKHVESFLSTHICINLSQSATRQDYPERPLKNIRKSDADIDIIYQSKEMKEIIERADIIANKNTSVLILGESGVGKEIIAKRLHAKSHSKGKLISVNLSNIPYDLFESECYGHEKGSFTGAERKKIGLFELADNGTLFIDEIGDIPLSMQVKLLRFLQEKEFMRVGGTKVLSSNFRLITATNRNLKKEIRSGRFREDLYYRINVVSINIPPLRERRDDILVLADHFLKHYCTRHQLANIHLNSDMQRNILNYPWPGNVRQLKNHIERYCINADDDLSFSPISTNSIKPKTAFFSDDQVPDIFSQKPTLQSLSNAYFEFIYTATNGTVGGESGIASILGISKPTVYAWIKRLGLKEKYKMRLLHNPRY